MHSLINTIIGCGCGLYVGGWLMFIKPILAAAAAYDAGVLTGMIIAVTTLKCILATSVGFVVCYLVFFILECIYDIFKKLQKKNK